MPRGAEDLDIFGPLGDRSDRNSQLPRDDLRLRAAPGSRGFRPVGPNPRAGAEGGGEMDGVQLDPLLEEEPCRQRAVESSRQKDDLV